MRLECYRLPMRNTPITIVLGVALIASLTGCERYDGEVKLTGSAWIPVVDKKTGPNYLVPGKTSVTLRAGVVVIRNGIQKLKLKLPKKLGLASDDIRTVDLKGEAIGQPVDLHARVTGETKQNVQEVSHSRCSLRQTYPQPTLPSDPNYPGAPYRDPGSYYDGRDFACDDGEIVTESTYEETTDAVRLDFTDARTASRTRGTVLGSFETTATDRVLIQEENGPCLPVRQYTQPCYY